ncbi:MAG: hypothetical protein KC492_44400 [Myxococcales bacterium]|nr:hypothetical protein [Myxococcales bacterium]
MSEVIKLQAAHARVEAAERREAEAVADRRAAESRAAQAAERVANAERERAQAFSAIATAQEGCTGRITEAVKQEREAALAHRGDSKSGLIEENAALGSSVTRLLGENEALAKRVAMALEALDQERKEHARLRASRPDVQIEAEKATKELEKARVEASVRTK